MPDTHDERGGDVADRVGRIADQIGGALDELRGLHGANRAKRGIAGAVANLRDIADEVRRQLASATAPKPLPSISDDITAAEAEASATFDLTIDEVRALKADLDAATARAKKAEAQIPQAFASGWVDAIAAFRAPGWDQREAAWKTYREAMDAEAGAQQPERCPCGCPKIGDGCNCRFCNKPYPTQQPRPDGQATAGSVMAVRIYGGPAPGPDSDAEARAARATQTAAALAALLRRHQR